KRGSGRQECREFRQGACGVVCRVLGFCVVSGACAGDDKYVVQVRVFDCLLGRVIHRYSSFCRGHSLFPITCTLRIYNKVMCHDESLIITNITSAPARRKVRNIFEDQIPDAGESLLRKKNYEDARSVLLQCTISGEIVGGLLALHPSTQM